MLNVKINKKKLNPWDRDSSMKRKLKKLRNLIPKQFNIEGWNWLKKKIELLEGENKKNKLKNKQKNKLSHLGLICRAYDSNHEIRIISWKVNWKKLWSLVKKILN
jgi:hypothetical protein